MYTHERPLVKRLANRSFAFIGVNGEQDREALKKTMRDKEITWRNFQDGGETARPIASQFNVSEWPTIYVIDHKGVICHKSAGSPAKRNWMNGSTPWLKRPKPKQGKITLLPQQIETAAVLRQRPLFVAEHLQKKPC